jgi:hypothetical protein
MIIAKFYLFALVPSGTKSTQFHLFQQKTNGSHTTTRDPYSTGMPH